MSSNDFNGPYRPAGGRGANQDPGGARGAAWNGAGNPGGSARGAGNGYAPPEGWGDDGFWRDSAVDANYETGANPAVGPQGAHGAHGAHGARGAHGGYGGYGPPGPGQPRPQPGQPGRGRHEGPARPDLGGRGPGPGARPAHPGGAPGGAPTRAENMAGMRAGGAIGTATRVPPGGRRPAGPGGPGGPSGPGGYGPGGPGGRGPGGRGPGPRRPGYGSHHGPVTTSWWRTWTWKKALIVAAASFGGMAVLIALVGFIAYSQTSVPSQSLATAMDQNSTVYFNDGKTVVGTYGSVHRQLLSYNQIPKVMDDAVMSAEDRGFMTEGAIDPRGMLRAAYDDLAHGGGSLSGGSTITQQFVRNYYDDIGTQQTATRKIKEIFVAMKVSKEKSKQWILANYLNTIYLGQDAYGVAAAAQTYFGVPVSKLTAAQAAVIAAIIQQPSLYPQPQYRPQLENRWHYVLSGMVKMGDITAQQAATMQFPAMRPLGSQYTGTKPWDSYIMQEVQGELTGVDHITQHQLDTGGLKIKLTISPQAEQKLYDSVNSNISAIRASGYTLPPYALIGAEAENPATGGIEAVYPGPGMNAPKNQCNATCQLNTTLTSEQVGSSFKPYVLSAAVQQGMNVQSSILNANPTLWVPPFSMASTPSSPTKQPPPYYQVSNDKHEKIPGAWSNGGTSVQNALAQSSNTAFTDLAHRVGLQPIEQMAEAMGGVDPKTFAYTPGVGIALGINSLTVNDQASMMATIDNGGVYHQAHMVGSITQAGGGVTTPPVATHIALTPAEASQVQFALQKTVVNGTAPSARMADGRPIIGKTGTTTGSKSAFFIGGIPQDVLAVGIFTEHQGNDNTETLTALGGGGFGGTWPAAIWHSYAESMWAAMPIQNFLSPQFTGQPWLQLPKPPPPKPKPTPTPTDTSGNGNGGLFGSNPPGQPSTGPNCGLFGCTNGSANSPGATPSPNGPGNGNGGGGGAFGG